MKKLLLYGTFLVSTIASAQETETRKLTSFSKLQIGGSFDVFIETGKEESVKIVAGGISPDKIITEIKGNTLEIYLEKGEYRNIKTTVYLTYKSLDEIGKSGSGNLTCNSDFSTANFKLNTSGSGNIMINKKIASKQVTIRQSGSGNLKLSALETDDADISFSGSGDLDISNGHVKKQDIHLSGSGNFSAFGLKSDECTASISGSGNIDVSVSQLLEGKIAGSGNINYQGDAQVKKTGIVGSGRINRKS